MLVSTLAAGSDSERSVAAAFVAAASGRHLRVVCGRLGTLHLVDQHKEAVLALQWRKVIRRAAAAAAIRARCSAGDGAGAPNLGMSRIKAVG